MLLDVRNINVRSGPGTTFAVLGEPLELDSCLTFRALSEDETWLLIAPDQIDPNLQQYEGGWIRRNHIDFFAVTRENYEFLLYQLWGLTRITPHIEDARCEYLRRSFP